MLKNCVKDSLGHYSKHSPMRNVTQASGSACGVPGEDRSKNEDSRSQIKTSTPAEGGDLPGGSGGISTACGKAPRRFASRDEHRAVRRGVKTRRRQDLQIPSFATMCALVRAERDAQPDLEGSDLYEHIKDRCARSGFTYSSESVSRACNAVAVAEKRRRGIPPPKSPAQIARESAAEEEARIRRALGPVGWYR